MSVQPSQPSGDGQPAGSPAGTEGRRFSTLIGSLPATPADRQATTARPTFTAGASGPATAAPAQPADTPGSAVSSEEPASPTAAAPAAASQTPPDGEGTRALPRPASVVADEPLLRDVTGLRARWQGVQADFVDDPREAVGAAADLIEQTAQALVGALRQRQRQLRVMWESGTPDAPGAAAAGSTPPDTEHLRLMMQRYRALFNQLCRP